jgi:hypothetical protein
MIVTNVGRVAVDAEVPTTNGTMPGEAFWRRRVLRTAKSCGPDASALASSLWSDLQATVARKPITGESTYKP